MYLQFSWLKKVSETNSLLHVCIDINLNLHPIGPSAEPTNVTAATVNSESIYLSWEPPPFSEQNGQIQHYIINVTELDTGNSFIQIATGTEFTFYSLHPYYTYAFTIAAMTVDIGPTSNIIIAMTEEDGM